MIDAPPAPPTVMVVDDSPTILMSARQFLEPTYTVVTVKDGFAALAAIEEVRPDLLLLDIMMPRLDGYHVALALRQHPDFETLPIVILSARDSPFDKARCALIGCDDYLTKPFERDTLLAKIGDMLARPPAADVYT